MIDIQYTHHMKFDFSIRLSLDDSRCIGVYGKTGSGKTTFLKLICGVLSPDKGVVKPADLVWFDHEKKISVPIQQRNIGIVFQGYSLFPNMTVQENINFGYTGDIPMDNILMRFGITDLLKKKPSALSGGQAQRTAIARAVASNPELLLLDEPFSAQDEENRSLLYHGLKAFQQECNFKIIMVSHYKKDILAMCDRMIGLDKGKMTYDGKPIDYFEETIVNGNRITGEIVKILDNYITLSTATGYIKIKVSDQDQKTYSLGQQLTVEGAFEIQ